MTRTRATLLRIRCAGLHRWLPGRGGLTGSLLAFLPELEAAFNLHHRVAEPPGAVFDLLAVREAVLRAAGGARRPAAVHRDAGNALHLGSNCPTPRTAGRR